MTQPTYDTIGAGYAGRRQRPPEAAPCVRGSAEDLPVADDTFDAAMAVQTIHHWSDWRQ